MKKVILLKTVSLLTVCLILLTTISIKKSNAIETTGYAVDLSKLTYTLNGATSELKKYSQNDFETFLTDYNSGNLPAIYVTEFLFDGVSMVKTYDLDDFTESGNDVEVKTLKITAINVNTTGNVEFSGEITGGMIAVDTNNRSGEVNLILNNAKIDTDSKKAPAIYVYNKDITYTGCKVTIKTASGSQNYIEGGKFKKVSLVGKEELSNYTSKYSGTTQTNYTTYTNYYGVYTTEQINNILFAKVQADSEDLADGDPYYFYKGAGAISSDIDLYFEGTGYLEVKSKNKEGIETKGNLEFVGGTGDYAIYAEDDCLNTTTKSSSNKSARNTLTINVHSLYAIVDSGEDADEGDAIDSNGTLTINGGTIVAIAHPGQDAGIDSENGTYINGGTVIATGDMFDPVSSESKQSFIALSFANSVTADTLVTLLNEKDEVIMAYKTDRTYTNLIYSSSNLTNGTYSLYKNGEITGNQTNGYYTTIEKYTKGTRQAYSSTGMQGGMMGMNNGMPQNGQMPTGERPSGEAPTGSIPTGERPELPNEEMNNGNSVNMGQRPDKQGNMEINNGERPSMPDGEVPQNQGNMNNGNNLTSVTATNKDFVVSAISNQFSGIADYSGEEENTNNTSSLNNILSNNYVIAGIAGVSVVILLAIGIVIIKKKK